MRAQFEREAGLDSPWTSYNSSLGRPLLNTEKFLAPKKPVPVEDPIAALESELDESPEPTPTLPGLDPRR
jgi:hypothetical protein